MQRAFPEIVHNCASLSKGLNKLVQKHAEKGTCGVMSKGH